MILSGIHNLARFRNGVAYPHQLKLNPKNLDVASNLIDIFHSSISLKRFEIEDEIKATYIEKVNPKVVQGLAKILFSFSKFSDFGERDPQELRQKAFSASAEYWSSRPSVDIEIDHHKQNIFGTLKINESKAIQETEVFLFGDISSNQILQSFDSLSPESLVNRFNIGQIQGLLINAESMELNLSALNESSFRQVMQMLKFFQLMFTVEDADEEKITLKIDGPTSILENARSYGIEIANFFPSLLLLQNPWTLTSTLKIPSRKRKFRFDFSNQNSLVSLYNTKNVWNHEKVTSLVKRFNEKYGNEIAASQDKSLIALSNNRYLLPDIQFKHLANEQAAMLEWVHYLSDTKIQQLTALGKELPKNYLFAIKGNKTKLGKLKKQFGDRLLIFAKDLTAPSVFKAVGKLLESNS